MGDFKLHTGCETLYANQLKISMKLKGSPEMMRRVVPEEGEFLNTIPCVIFFVSFSKVLMRGYLLLLDVIFILAAQFDSTLRLNLAMGNIINAMDLGKF